MNNNPYLILNQFMFERLTDGQAHPEMTFRSTKGIIKSLEERIGRENIRVITPNQMYDPDRDNVATVYRLDETGRVDKTDEQFETPVVVMIDDNGFIPGFSMKDIERQHTFYRALQEKGRIGHMINTVDSKETNDKAKLPELFEEFNPPVQFNNIQSEDVKDLISDYGRLILKHRFGSDGRYFYVATPENYDSILEEIGSSLDEYVCQPAFDIAAESRLVFIDGKVVGSRIIRDRRLPGESKQTSTKSHQVDHYTPSEEEVQNTLDAAKKAMMEAGCVDWIYLRDGTRHILELNDVGTAMISDTSEKHEVIYKLFDPLADQIVKYIK